MFESHKTRDGITLYISQMDDTHLINTIQKSLHQLETLKGISVKVNLSDFKKALYDLDEEDFTTRNADRIRKETRRLYPYLAEAMLRGLSFKEDLQRIFERTGVEGANSLRVSPFEANISIDE